MGGRISDRDLEVVDRKSMFDRGAFSPAMVSRRSTKKGWQGPAFENLERAYAERNLNLAHIFRVPNRHFGLLRDDPRSPTCRRIDAK
jgi:hypothetical protein